MNKTLQNDPNWVVLLFPKLELDLCDLQVDISSLGEESIRKIEEMPQIERNAKLYLLEALLAPADNSWGLVSQAMNRLRALDWIQGQNAFVDATGLGTDLAKDSLFVHKPLEPVKKFASGVCRVSGQGLGKTNGDLPGVVAHQSRKHTENTVIFRSIQRSEHSGAESLVELELF
jgi:hypothetical protein